MLSKVIGKLTQSKYFTLFIGFLLGLSVITSVKYVFAHGGNLNFIHACVKNSNGSIHIIGLNDTCANGESPLDWTRVPWNSDFPMMCQNCDLSKDSIGNLLVGKDLSNAIIVGSNLSGQDLTNVTLTGAHLHEINFTGANLQGKNFSGYDLQNSNFDSANVTNVNFTGADLSRTQFTAANISGVNFTNANLHDSHLRGVLNAWAATFVGVSDMNGTQLDDTDLSNTNFSGISFGVSSFTYSNLSNANFSNVFFGAVNLNHATGFDTANRTGVSYNDTTCPDGTNSNTNGNTCEGHLTP